MDKDRYSRGLEKLKEIDGEAGERVIQSLKEIAPDLDRYVIELMYAHSPSLAKYQEAGQADRVGHCFRGFSFVPCCST